MTGKVLIGKLRGSEPTYLDESAFNPIAIGFSTLQFNSILRRYKKKKGHFNPIYNWIGSTCIKRCPWL